MNLPPHCEIILHTRKVGPRPCANSAKFKIDGTWVCGIHHNQLLKRAHPK